MNQLEQKFCISGAAFSHQRAFSAYSDHNQKRSPISRKPFEIELSFINQKSCAIVDLGGPDHIRFDLGGHLRSFSRPSRSNADYQYLRSL